MGRSLRPKGLRAGMGFLRRGSQQSAISPRVLYSPPVRSGAEPWPLKVFLYSRGTRYDTRWYFNVCSKADMSQVNLPHGNDN